MNRRRFLKYAGATAAAGAAALGLGYFFNQTTIEQTKLMTGSSVNLQTGAGPESTPTTLQNTTTTTTVSSAETSQIAESLLNKNEDFCSGADYWHPWHDVNELGYPNGLPRTKWGYSIEPCQYGKLWINNPDLSQWDHAGLAQWSDDFPPNPNWQLSRRKLLLETDAMLTEPDALQTNGENNWDRLAIVFQWRRIDGLNYIVDGNSYQYLYSEFDLYRHNANFFHSKGTNVYEYHADQLPFEQFRHYTIDVNDFCENGYEAMGGWGEFASQSLLSAWYLVVESQGGAISGAWRNVQLRLK